MRRFECVYLDVFTSRPLHGNQLAVFTDARGLREEELQMLAKETNLSENDVHPARRPSRRAAEWHQGPDIHRRRGAGICRAPYVGHGICLARPLRRAES